jgi:hypothetical protein
MNVLRLKKGIEVVPDDHIKSANETRSVDWAMTLPRVKLNFVKTTLFPSKLWDKDLLNA